jgi:hypothetical protein
MVGNLEVVMGAPRVVRLLSVGALYLLLSPPATAQSNVRLTSFESESALNNYFRDIVRDRLKYIQDQEKKRCGNHELTITRKKSGLPATIVTGLVQDSRGKTPLHGALILARNLATRTGPDGHFRLDVPTPDPKQPTQISIRAIGYSARSFQVRAGDSLEVLAPMCVIPFHLEEKVVTASGDPSITNVQHAGVDEGGIVKLHGNHLVILRRGRLFTVAIGDTTLRPVAAVDAYDPSLSPEGTEYDEMLIYRDKVLVLGVSYARTTAELGIFRIDAQGGLRYLTTHQFKAHDYYSSRNYASRLIGSRLVFYTPYYLGINLADPLTVLPAIRRWGVLKDKAPFERLVTPQTFYRTDWRPSPREWVVVHTVTECDLDSEPLRCTASAVTGGADRSFYVSPRAVYVWSGQGGETDGVPNATLLRFGIGRQERPGAMAVQGSPIDQFSFLESEDGWLNVLVQSQRRGDAMWRAECRVGDLALLRVATRDFGETLRQSRQAEYRGLPRVTGVVNNRFVGGHLLYGAGNGWVNKADTATLLVVPVAGGRVTRLPLPHGADRIEVMGKDAAVIGASDRDLLFTGVALGSKPELVQRLMLPGASQGELRSHGFFYRADGKDGGVIGLPYRGGGEAGWKHLIRGSAGVVFVENRGNRFTKLGVLEAAPADTSWGKDCKSWLSCVDWYGNARPLFVGRRVFALMGYELVEGVLKDRRIQEVRRVGFGGSQSLLR